LAEEIQRLTFVDSSVLIEYFRKSIEFQDLIIAATAISFNNPLATINKKHFDNIEGLDLITPDDL
jgi:predicted nucleic acid-binding protein